MVSGDGIVCEGGACVRSQVAYVNDGGGCIFVHVIRQELLTVQLTGMLDAALTKVLSTLTSRPRD